MPYTEIELSPHGHYLVLRFAGVRNRMAEGLPLSFTAAIDGGRWTGAALLPPDLLPSPPLRVNAYAVHGVGAGRHYLAMIPVLGEKADLHRPELFRDPSDPSDG